MNIDTTIFETKPTKDHDRQFAHFVSWFSDLRQGKNLERFEMWAQLSEHVLGWPAFTIAPSRGSGRHGSNPFDPLKCEYLFPVPQGRVHWTVNGKGARFYAGEHGSNPALVMLTQKAQLQLADAVAVLVRERARRIYDNRRDGKATRAINLRLSVGTDATYRDVIYPSEFNDRGVADLYRVLKAFLKEAK